MRILLATSNPHKRDEILMVWCHQRHGQDGLSVELIGLDAVDPGHDIVEPVEDGLTFEANVTIKGCYYAQATGLVTLADDSGLDVDALGGQPGVHSARYAGQTGLRRVVDQANNDRLLRELSHRATQDRTARFVCAMALCAPSQTGGARVLALVRGTVHGRIIGPGESPRGENGFGYDPLFLLPELGKTTAELSPQEKNAMSHRGKAARLMWYQIQQLVDEHGVDPVAWPNGVSLSG